MGCLELPSVTAESLSCVHPFCASMDRSTPSSPWGFPSKDTGGGCHVLPPTSVFLPGGVLQGYSPWVTESDMTEQLSTAQDSTRGSGGNLSNLGLAQGRCLENASLPFSFPSTGSRFTIMLQHVTVFRDL